MTREDPSPQPASPPPLDTALKQPDETSIEPADHLADSAIPLDDWIAYEGEDVTSTDGVAPSEPPPSEAATATGAPPASPVADVRPPPIPTEAVPASAPARSPEGAPVEEPLDLDGHIAFRSEVQQLARQHRWGEIARVTAAAVDQAIWARFPQTKAALLLDLAKINRDRLNDAAGAEAAFRQLALIDPANADAIAFLSQTYQGRGEWQALYQLLANAVEPCWDPALRLAWTREMVGLAEDKLGQPDLAVAAWEHLWRLGETNDETFAALSRTYRRSGRWDGLAAFLGQRANQLRGAARVVLLREIAEAYLSGLRDQEQAEATLEQILDERPDDPVAILARARLLAQRRDWEELAAVGARPLANLPRAAVLDFRRLVADALWSGGELERAAAAFTRVLELDPEDAEALRAREEYLATSGQYQALVTFLDERAARVKPEGERAQLWSRAAQLAEEKLGDARLAMTLWEKRAQIESGRVEAYAALARLCEVLGDLPGVTRALEGQLAITRQPAQRVRLLQQLGEHAAVRLGDDVMAERCWREIISLTPDDAVARRELVTLHRRKGDFAALDRALVQQAWRAGEETAALSLWRLAAANCEENLKDTKRAVAAWLRVLDLAPKDAAALRALIGHQRTLGDRRVLIGSLEALAESSTDPDEQTAIALEIARLCEEDGARGAALARHEGILQRQPTNSSALQGLGRLADAGTLRGALEVAAALSPAEERAGLLQRAVGESQDPLTRFFGLRRLLWQSSDPAKMLPPLAETARDAHAWEALAAVLEELASRTSDAKQSAHFQQALARVAEEQLGNPVRALLALAASGRSPIADEATLANVHRLCQTTHRHEDAMALAGAQAIGATDEERSQALRRRLAICEHDLKDGERAFHEAARLLALRPDDEPALASIHRLAEAHGLWRACDALHAELWDRAGSVEERVAIALTRSAIAADKLGDAQAALDQLLIAYRLQPTRPGLQEAVLERTRALGAWERVLPLLEAHARLLRESAPEELVRMGRLYEEERGDQGHAFELYAEALIEQPALDLCERLERLAREPGLGSRLVAAYRLAAAHTPDPKRKLELYRYLIEPCARLGLHEEALDVHRRILQLEPGALASLEVLVASHRAAGEWRELRDRLQQWSDEAPPTNDRLPIWLEIAHLSNQQLGEPEMAFAAYSKILELDPTHAEALAGVRSLTEGKIDPNLEIRRLRIQLERASGERRDELLLAVAKLQQSELDDTDAAIATLRSLLAERGAGGPADQPLAALYREARQWQGLVELLEMRAATLEGSGRVAALLEAVEICDLHPEVGTPERRERLYRMLLAAQPGNRQARYLLLGFYREAGRFEELADLLRETLAGNFGDDAEERGWLEDERIRVLDLGLHRTNEAEALVCERHEKQPEREDLLLALACFRRRSHDFASYLRLRQELARRTPAPLASLVLCHLAEACDETEGFHGRVAELYREARILDGNNASATEALKAIGRRARGWRAQAALLPDSDEASLSWDERSRRLSRRGEEADDAAVAHGWFMRAVAVDPDQVQAWDGLAQVCAKLGDKAAHLEAQRQALAAFERSIAPSPDRLREHAERIQDLAIAHRAVDHHDEAARLFARAHGLVPSLPGAALMVADERLTAGDIQSAFELYDRVLRKSQGELTTEERLHATYQRGALLVQLGALDRATLDLREALRIEPLHSGALEALADVLARQGRVAAAVQHSVQALLVVDDPLRRGQLYARLGRLWEDYFQRMDEAGVCYDLAVSAGVEDRELMLRALHHHRRRGDATRALDLLSRLLPNTREASEQAELWTERGGILSDSDEQQAMEAYDMALSYDPGNRAALTGLSRILERRGDWTGLVQIFEARTESGSAEERADALRALAQITSSHLHDTVRSEHYLQAAVALAPRREDYEQLLSLYANLSGKEDSRRAALAGLLALGGPWMTRMIELGRLLVSTGERAWAWCLLSPLMAATIPDPSLKAVVLDLRKEFEKSDRSQRLRPQLGEQVLPLLAGDPLRGALAELDELVSLGPTSFEQVGGANVTRLDERTAVGKVFANICHRMDIDGVQLFRAQDLPGAFTILDTKPAQVAVRAELLQLLAPQETSFLFAALAELARPGGRLLASLDTASRAQLWSALQAASRGETPIAELQPWLAKLDVAAAREHLQANAAAFGHWETLPTRGERLWRAIRDSAHRVGLLASGDLRFVARLFTRLDENLPKMPMVAKIDELDVFFAACSSLQELISFAASKTFGELVASGG